MFTEAERQIYEPSSPRGRVYGRFDPLRVRGLLVLKAGGTSALNDLLDAHERPAADPQRATDAEEVAWAKARMTLADISRAAFALPTVAVENGVTDAEGIELLLDFLDYLGNSPATGNGSPPTSPSAEQAG